MGQIWQIGGHTFEWGARTYVMGILNVTPDSFSDGGKFVTLDAALRHAEQLIAAGADMIDIGGESTRPGFRPVPADEELRRVIPVIEAIRARFSIPISIDTYKAITARQALEAGAHIINDIWGLKADREMAAVAAQWDCPVIIMHNRKDMDYTDFVADVKRDLRQSVAIAEQAGVKRERIILDPGIGFAKNHEHNLQMMKHLAELRELGFPLLLGTSRKRFIRNTLGLPVDDVVEGTAATVVLGIAAGCDIVRVHDVKEIKRSVAMADAIVRFRENAAQPV
ncbi:MAG TPA: dihydropteroate synthase [Bacilli bacterium]